MMPQQQLGQSTSISIQQLKELSGTPGPCITALFPLHHEDSRHIRLAIKRAIEGVEQRLEQRNIDRKPFEALMQPLRSLPTEIEGETDQKGVVILRSRDIFQLHFVPRDIEESIIVADHFHLLPLIPLMWETRPFYILALSQKHIRLLRCTNTISEDVKLPASVPLSLDDFLQMDQPDHMLDNASSAGPAGGRMVMFGTTAEKERKDQHLLHFYKEVDRVVTELLKNDTAPLVIAGVEYELPLYRSVSRFPRLASEGVRGAADGLKGGELHKRALDVMEAYWRKDVDDALVMYEQFGGSARASVSVKGIVKAAYEGRVLHLFATPDAHHTGNFDEATHQVRAHRQERAGDEDLINAAAVETLRHGGNVYVIPANRIPHGSQMAAVMRY